MQETEWIWLNGEWLKWGDAKVHFVTHALHYGSAVFEGIRCYKTDKGPAIFRLHDHMERFFYSMSVLKMPPRFDLGTIERRAIELVNRNGMEEGYLRPLAFFGYGSMGVNPQGLEGDIGIACWPWGAYLPHELVDIKISHYMRLHPRSVVADAKVSGHYVNSILAGLELRGTHYHEALLLDYQGYIAEGPGENIFIVKDGVLKTPKVGSILRGFTRDTVIKIAGMDGIVVEECDISPEEAFTADEAFFTGTAAEVTPIRSIDDHVFGDGKVGPITKHVKERYLNTVHGRVPELLRLLSFVG